MSTITTRAFGTQSSKANLEPLTIERRAPLEDDVAIKILYCGVCHTDLHMVNEDWKKNLYPLVPGHEIIGEVSAVGSKVSKFKVGDKVGVGFSVDSCRKCDTCKKGLVQYCVDNVQTAAFVDKFHDGRQTFGGYSELIVVRQDYVVSIPSSLDLAAAAPLLCAGITMYSPLAWYKVGKGTKVGIVGLGGLGHMGVKFARAMGAEVTVFSQSDQSMLSQVGAKIAHAVGASVSLTTDKESEAKRLGADRVIVSDDKEQMEAYADYFDLIINTIPYQHDISPYIGCVGVGGTHVCAGYMGPTSYKLDTSLLIFGRKSVAGTAIGSTNEMQEMLEFSAKHGIVANIEKIDIKEVNEVYKRMLKSEVDHRYVIDMATI